MTVHCFYCREEVGPLARTTWRRVIGWERKAQQQGSRKGGSDVALREPRDEFACEPCVSFHRGRSVSRGQGALL